jgi:hypothetical protein
MTQGSWVKGRNEVTSRVGTILWLLAVLLVDWGSAGGFQVGSEVPGGSHTAASLIPKAHPAALPRDQARIAALETDRQKANRGARGKNFGATPGEAPLPLVAHHVPAPILRSHMPWSAPSRVFEPRGPPHPIA